MPRPWDNAPWRRKAMQGVLCGVLGLSLVLSWLLSRSRGAALGPTAWENRQAGSLLIRLPALWKSESGWSWQEGSRYVVREPKPYMGVQRIIVIRRSSVKPGTAPRDIADRDPRASLQTPEPFDFLGQHGLLYELPMELIDTDEGREPLMPLLLAVVVLPESTPGAGPTTVTVRLEGPRIFVPADRELLQTVARSMKETNAAGRGVAATQTTAGRPDSI